VPLYERIALYSIADVAVVTATRDGMNLVPYEYIVCRQGADVSLGLLCVLLLIVLPRLYLLVVLADASLPPHKLHPDAMHLLSNLCSGGIRSETGLNI
jgi:Glycosyltransferase family 20